MAELQRAIARYATQQDGAVTRRQLIDHGMTPSAIRRAVRSGWLTTEWRGVFTVSGAPQGLRQRLWIAHLAAGDRSVISHGSAGALWRFEGVKVGAPTLSLPHDVRRRIEGLGIVHRTRCLASDDIEVIGGLPVTTAARTIVDLAGDYRPARLAAVLDHAHFAKIASFVQVGEVLLRVGGSGVRGTAHLARLLDERSGGRALEQSVLERHLSALFEKAGASNVSRQHPLPSLGGVDGVVDAYIPSARLIVEADGRRWHSRQSDMLRDRDRDFAAAQAGVMTLRLLAEHLTSDLDGCVAGLRRVVESRRSVQTSTTAAANCDVYKR